MSNRSIRVTFFTSVIPHCRPHTCSSLAGDHPEGKLASRLSTRDRKVWNFHLSAPLKGLAWVTGALDGARILRRATGCSCQSQVRRYSLLHQAPLRCNHRLRGRPTLSVQQVTRTCITLSEQCAQTMAIPSVTSCEFSSSPRIPK